jgi:hypothetical protein
VQVWLDEVHRHLCRYSDREIRVRWKKDAGHRPIGRDLHGAYAVVVYSSAAALDALIAGVPIITLAPWAATRRMGRSQLAEINDLLYPEDREAFFIALAANQWTISEIFQGEAWKTLQAQREDRRAAA